MWRVSGKFLDAIRHSQTKIATVMHLNLVTGQTSHLAFEDGAVTVDATSKVRRTLRLTLPASEATWNVLDTPGGEITVTQGFRYLDGTTELVPLGVFIVDQDSIGYGPSGQITVAAPDRWVKVQRNRFGLNRSSVKTNLAWQEIKRLVEAAFPAPYAFPGWAQLETSGTSPVGSLLWDDGDREAAILDLCRSNGVEVFFDAQGYGVLRTVPTLTPASSPVWLVDAGRSGVMIDGLRTRDRSTLRNVYIISSTATDVNPSPVEVKNTTDGDPLNVNGPMGYVAEDWSSPSFRSTSQMRSAGLTRLSKSLGFAKQLSLTAVGNPALDAQDVIQALLPKIDRNTPRPSELHIIDTVTHPLAPSGTQDIATRSTRPDTDGA